MSKYRKKQIRNWRRHLASLPDDVPHGPFIEEIRVLETLELQEQAQSFGVSLLPEHVNAIFYWTNIRDDRRHLTDEGLILAKNRIIDARFSYWKRWIDIVTPVASTIISIIALIIAIIALNR